MLDFASWLVYAVTGRVLIYVWFLFPLPVRLPAWLDKLHNCDLCAGVWIYSILAIYLQADIFSPVFGVPPTIVGEISTGVVTSVLVHVFMIGLKEKFAPPIVIS